MCRWALFAEQLQAGLADARTGRHAIKRENTLRMTGAFTKAASWRSRAAFAKLNAVVLLEVGLHNPLALTLGLLAQLTEGVLLFSDRLHGYAAELDQVQARYPAVSNRYLIRSRKNLKARVIAQLPNGSFLLEGAVPDSK